MNVSKKKGANANTGAALLVLLMLVIGIAIVWADQTLMPKYKQQFLEIEKQRITISNQLMTIKIVQEDMNHVRDLIFSNMDFPGQPDSVDHESQFFEFVTSCVNDLKLKLVSVRPASPHTSGRITTYSYDVEIEGDFFRFGELCAKFENNRRLVAIEGFDVDLIGDREGHGLSNSDFRSENKNIRVKMKINTFRISKS
ncbi:MAG: hypothetical protein FWB85_05590 [Chitinispirillia bacterium]|nr:hypothetical protein [Chitinispirillia bacterium]MCL2241703.1 hypothetical protein [Chitinispirillia bacterium]